jgi:CheY-like chemotaxis protein
MRALIVEDHRDTGRALVLLLGSQGIEALLAASAQEARQLCEEHRFDLVISDIGLCGCTGWELLPQLCRHGPLKAIAMSAYDGWEDLERSQSAGFRAHLAKPLDFEQLMGTIRSVMAEGQA